MVGGPVFNWRSWPYFRLALTKTIGCSRRRPARGPKGRCQTCFTSVTGHEFRPTSGQDSCPMGIFAGHQWALSWPPTHEHREIETTFSELRSAIRRGRALQSRNVALAEQEVYWLLVTEQPLHTIMSKTTIPALGPGRGPGQFRHLAEPGRGHAHPRAENERTPRAGLALAGGNDRRTSQDDPSTTRAGYAQVTELHGPTEPQHLTVRIIDPETRQTAKPIP